MTAPTTDRPPIRRRRRRQLIERPRLMKLLDGADQRILLLAAPAGYGKTTLARQWAKTLRQFAWVSLTPAHRDVATFGEDVAAEVERLGGAPLFEFQTYLRARPNPQRAGREIAHALARRVNEARIQWLIFDDFHELADAPEMADAFAQLISRVEASVMVTSRVRPDWATPRRALYGEIFELDRDVLSMDAEESAAVVGGTKGRERLFEVAQGWPAVLTLAASPLAPAVPADSLPDTLHQYLADELFAAATPTLRDRLIEMALLPETSPATLRARWEDADEVIEQARELGFLTATADPELHPLIRDFLLRKLGDDRDAEARVRQAVQECTTAGAWTRAFELIIHFGLDDLKESALERAYRPLSRTGKIATLARFAESCEPAHGFPPPIVDLVEAELAYRAGAFRLASELATTAIERWPDDHSLRSRARMIEGQSAWAEAAFEPAKEAFADALEHAHDEDDAGEALYGAALVDLHGDERQPIEAARQLRERKRRSPNDFIRWANIETLSRRFTEGFAAPLQIEDALRARERSDDARIRTSFGCSASYVMALRAEYTRALELALKVLEEARVYELRFAVPHMLFNLGLVQLGLRRFGEAQRAVERIERDLAERPNGHHELNARILRTRLALTAGNAEQAAETILRPACPDVPATRGEIDAMAAIALACLGETAAASRAAGRAEATTKAQEVFALATAARSIVAATAKRRRAALAIVDFAKRLGYWDALVLALRSSDALLQIAGEDEEARLTLGQLFRRSNDFGLGRQIGLRLPPSHNAGEVLTPRELEVMELLARGLRNRAISQALVISDSTTKVHIRHIFEKLGVRSRTEAVTRYAEIIAQASAARTSADG